MFGVNFTLAQARLTALPSGALWWASERLLVVGDLHLGRSERTARLGGALLPPYETRHTLERLEAEVAETRPAILVLLGDSFDDTEAALELSEEALERINLLAAGRRLVWIAGNHDPGHLSLPGENVHAYRHQSLTFRHIAEPNGRAEVSAHFHPKARLTLRGQRISRPCFLVDDNRVILPAFGTYTGGLDISHPAFDDLMGEGAHVLLTGRQVTALPYPVPA